MTTTNRPAPAPPPDAAPDPRFLIADAAALAAVPPSRLRSWEQAGLLRPHRTSGGLRLYDAIDIARARLIARSLDNPGRRGSLRRLAARLAQGDLRPSPEDYAGLRADPPAHLDGDAAAPGSPAVAAESSVADEATAALDAIDELVATADGDGRLTYANRALRSVLGAEPLPRPMRAHPPNGAAPPPDPLLGLAELSLRWTARTGVPRRNVPLALRSGDGSDRATIWNILPLRDEGGSPRGAVAFGRELTVDQADAQAGEDRLAAAVTNLRSPIASVVGNLQLATRAATALAERGGGSPSRAPSLDQPSRAAALPPTPPLNRLVRHLTMAEAATRQLLRTMDTLADASAAAAGGLVERLEPTAVDLVDLAEDVVQHARSLTTKHDITLAASAPLAVLGDRERLRQVLDNLLANAIRYAPEGGPIDMRLDRVSSLPPNAGVTTSPPTNGARQWALLQVTDQGVGISAADQPHIFDRYHRGGGPARQVPGTGLGLYASRAIVAVHGGHMWVERSSVPELRKAAVKRRGERWHGTVIAFALPLATGE